MIKVNVSPLKCIGHGCVNIPTIVLDFADPSGMRIKGQVITCAQHRQEGLEAGKQFGRFDLRESNYPRWLQTLHSDIIHEGPKKDSVRLEEGDLERLRTFLYSGHKKSPEGI